MPDDPLRSPPPEEQAASPEIVMFFLGPDGEPIVDDGDGEGQGTATAPPLRTLAELYRSWRRTLDDERDQDDFHRHRPADRQVQGIGRPGRSGFRDEIVVTLRSDPMAAVSEALGRDPFEPPIGGLTVDGASRQTSRYELCWAAAIREWPWRSRPARLRLYASPSFNVSVLSLFPDKPRRVARRHFLRVGLRAMNALRDRIDERAGMTFGSRPAGPIGAGSPSAPARGSRR